MLPPLITSLLRQLFPVLLAHEASIIERHIKRIRGDMAPTQVGEEKIPPRWNTISHRNQARVLLDALTRQHERYRIKLQKYVQMIPKRQPHGIIIEDRPSPDDGLGRFFSPYAAERDSLVDSREIDETTLGPFHAERNPIFREGIVKGNAVFMTEPNLDDHGLSRMAVAISSTPHGECYRLSPTAAAKVVAVGGKLAASASSLEAHSKGSPGLFERVLLPTKAEVQEALEKASPERLEALAKRFRVPVSKLVDYIPSNGRGAIILDESLRLDPKYEDMTLEEVQEILADLDPSDPLYEELADVELRLQTRAEFLGGMMDTEEDEDKPTAPLFWGLPPSIYTLRDLPREIFEAEMRVRPLLCCDVNQQAYEFHAETIPFLQATPTAPFTWEVLKDTIDSQMLLFMEKLEQWEARHDVSRMWLNMGHIAGKIRDGSLREKGTARPRPSLVKEASADLMGDDEEYVQRQVGSLRTPKDIQKFFGNIEPFADLKPYAFRDKEQAGRSFGHPAGWMLESFLQALEVPRPRTIPDDSGTMDRSGSSIHRFKLNLNGRGVMEVAVPTFAGEYKADHEDASHLRAQNIGTGTIKRCVIGSSVADILKVHEDGTSTVMLYEDATSAIRGYWMPIKAGSPWIGQYKGEAEWGPMFYRIGDMVHFRTRAEAEYETAKLRQVPTLSPEVQTADNGTPYLPIVWRSLGDVYPSLLEFMRDMTQAYHNGDVLRDEDIQAGLLNIWDELRMHQEKCMRMLVRANIHHARPFIDLVERAKDLLVTDPDALRDRIWEGPNGQQDMTLYAALNAWLFGYVMPKLAGKWVEHQVLGMSWLSADEANELVLPGHDDEGGPVFSEEEIWMAMGYTKHPDYPIKGIGHLIRMVTERFYRSNPVDIRPRLLDGNWQVKQVASWRPNATAFSCGILGNMLREMQNILYPLELPCLGRTNIHAPSAELLETCPDWDSALRLHIHKLFPEDLWGEKTWWDIYQVVKGWGRIEVLRGRDNSQLATSYFIRLVTRTPTVESFLHGYVNSRGGRTTAEVSNWLREEKLIRQQLRAPRILAAQLRSRAPELVWRILRHFAHSTPPADILGKVQSALDDQRVVEGLGPFAMNVVRELMN